MVNQEQYERRTIENACFYIPSGMYSIAQLETMLRIFKQAKEIQDEHLTDSVQIRSQE